MPDSVLCAVFLAHCRGQRCFCNLWIILSNAESEPGVCEDGQQKGSGDAEHVL